MTTSDFKTYAVPTYHVKSEEDLLARVMAEADVELPSDHVYQNMLSTVYVLKLLVVTSSPSCKWTQLTIINTFILLQPAFNAV